MVGNYTPSPSYSCRLTIGWRIACSILTSPIIDHDQAGIVQEWLFLMSSQALDEVGLRESLLGTTMASITILGLDDDVRTRLRTRAAVSGCLMEEGAQLILREPVGRKAIPEKGLESVIHELPKPLGDFALEFASRDWSTDCAGRLPNRGNRGTLRYGSGDANREAGERTLSDIQLTA